MSGLPIIDLQPFLSGDPAAKRRVADEVDRVCRDRGFFCIAGHDVAEQAYDDIYRMAKAFFALSDREKRLVRQPAPDQIRGYIAYGAAGLGKTRGEETPPDWKESFSVGPVDVDPADPYYAGPLTRHHFAPNLWPRAPEGFREIWSGYYREMTRLASDVMRLFAVALALPEPFFAERIDRHIAILGAQFYPAQDKAPEPGQLRAGAHTDFGTLTILRADRAAGGLEIKTGSGTWQPVVQPPGCYVVNIGDMMARWTNDRWISTLHRVVNPPADSRAGAERLSIGFFHEPNYDTLVECLPSCCSAERPARYEAIRAGEHLYWQFASQARDSSVT